MAGLVEAPADEQESEADIQSSGGDAIPSSSKISALIDNIQRVRALGEKAVVFSQFSSFLTLIEKALEKSQFKSVRLDGSMVRFTLESGS